MRSTRTILLMTLLGTLLSCNDLPKEYFQGEQCSPEFKIIQDIEGKEWVDVEQSVCRCRTSRISRDMVGPVDRKVIRKRLSSCNLLKGYSPKEDTRLVNFLEWVRMNIESKTTSEDSLSLPRQPYNK